MPSEGKNPKKPFVFPEKTIVFWGFAQNCITSD
jgi:hypothetical protein